MKNSVEEGKVIETGEIQIDSEPFFGLFRQIADMPIGIEYHQYYDTVFAEVYDHISYQIVHEMDFYLSMIPRKDAEILEIACGSGRLTIPLLKHGYYIDALDLSEAMLERLSMRLSGISEKSRSRCKIIRADIFDFTSDKKYDFVCIPATSLCLLASNCTAMESLFVKIYEMLNPGGRFAFDFREYPSHKEPKHSDVYSEYFENNGVSNFLLFQEFNNYVPGYSIVNYYLEKMEETAIRRIVCSSSKKILTRKMISKAMRNVPFSLTYADTIIYSDTISCRFLCYEK